MLQNRSQIEGEIHENTKKVDAYDPDGDVGMYICHAGVCISSEIE